MTIAEMARATRSCEDFLAFLVQLAEDHRVNRAAWTNDELATFLAAMAAWLQDMDGYYDSRGEDVSSMGPWRLFSDVMMAARCYE
jgi:hypothetical protein